MPVGLFALMGDIERTEPGNVALAGHSHQRPHLLLKPPGPVFQCPLELVFRPLVQQAHTVPALERTQPALTVAKVLQGIEHDQQSAGAGGQFFTLHPAKMQGVTLQPDRADPFVGFIDDGIRQFMGQPQLIGGQIAGGEYSGAVLLPETLNHVLFPGRQVAEILAGIRPEKKPVAQFSQPFGFVQARRGLIHLLAVSGQLPVEPLTGDNPALRQASEFRPDAFGNGHVELICDKIVGYIIAIIAHSAMADSYRDNQSSGSNNAPARDT